MDELEFAALKKLKTEITNHPEKLLNLSTRERDIITFRLGLPEGAPFREQEFLAQLYGVSLSRIKTLEAKAIRKLNSPDDPGGACVLRSPKSPHSGDNAGSPDL